MEKDYRCTGRTTRQIESMPFGGVFVWVSEDTQYPQTLCTKLGRRDVKVVGPSWLTGNRWQGLELMGLSLDHEAEKRFTDLEWQSYQHAQTRIRRNEITSNQT